MFPCQEEILSRPLPASPIFKSSSALETQLAPLQQTAAHRTRPAQLFSAEPLRCVAGIFGARRASVTSSVSRLDAAGERGDRATAVEPVRRYQRELPGQLV